MDRREYLAPLATVPDTGVHSGSLPMRRETSDGFWFFIQHSRRFGSEYYTDTPLDTAILRSNLQHRSEAQARSAIRFAYAGAYTIDDVPAPHRSDRFEPAPRA